MASAVAVFDGKSPPPNTASFVGVVYKVTTFKKSFEPGYLSLYFWYVKCYESHLLTF